LIDQGKRNVLGVNIDAVDYEAVVARVQKAARAGERVTCSALAVHGVMTGVLDSAHRYRLNRLDLVVPDGQPVRWALRLLHRLRLPDRVYGPQLALEVCRMASREELPIFLYGSTPEVIKRLHSNLNLRFPSLHIAGAEPSKLRQLTPAEKRTTIERVRESGAAITFVGLGCPRQEVWAFEFGDELSMPVLAVGAAFDFLAGMLPQAPQTLQRAGLEWLYRLAQEPSRLWKRYLFLNPLYLSLLGLQLLRVWELDPEAASRPDHELRFG
jgi:exopolysaccharide biosynthesis WecB/TagA/CpsF family protein